MKKIHDPYTRKEIWQITDEPDANITHRYHNIDAFSKDGRYLVYGRDLPHLGPEAKTRSEVGVYDLAQKREIGRHPGAMPCWNPCKNQVVYSNSGKIILWDIETGSVKLLAEVFDLQSASVDRTGRFALCYYGLEAFKKGKSGVVRVPLAGGVPELIQNPGPEVYLSMPTSNPAHDVYSVRYHAPKPGMEVTHPTFKRLGLNIVCRYLMIVGTDGSNPHPVTSYDEWGHYCWSGDGEWFIIGPHCKRWDARPEEPWQEWSALPVGFNHPAPCGRDGRLLVGDFGNIFTYVFNRQTQELMLMNAPMSNSIPYSKNADPHPIGSPDGTKYVFDSMYDLEHAPVTRLTASIGPGDDILAVESTAGFPESGCLVLGYSGCGPEVIHYGKKQGHFFLECKRGSPPEISKDTEFTKQSNGSVAMTFGRGTNVMAYAGLHLSDGVRREPDVYVHVIRPPQHPRTVRARRESSAVQVSWKNPRNSREFRAYGVWRCEEGKDWTRLEDIPVGKMEYRDVRPPEGPLLYAVSSVEHSGLESARSAEAVIASQDGRHLPQRIFLPVGDADLNPSLYASPEEALTETIDEAAYNQRAVIQRHGGSPLRWIYSMPCAAVCSISVHCRTMASAAMVNFSCNKNTWTRFVDAAGYIWLPVTMDADERGVGAALETGDNILVLSAPAETLVVDALRLDFNYIGEKI